MYYIIHVDNSDFFRKITKNFLAEIGYESDGFARGEDVLDLIMADKGDCVITGLELADMSGEEFIKHLAVAKPMIPIIVLTANDEDNQRMRLENLGIKAIIQKSGNWKNELQNLLVLIREQSENGGDEES